MEKGATVVTSASRSRSVMLPAANWRRSDSNLLRVFQCVVCECVPDDAAGRKRGVRRVNLAPGIACVRSLVRVHANSEHVTAQYRQTHNKTHSSHLRGSITGSPLAALRTLNSKTRRPRPGSCAGHPAFLQLVTAWFEFIVWRGSVRNECVFTCVCINDIPQPTLPPSVTRLVGPWFVTWGHRVRNLAPRV